MKVRSPDADWFICGVPSTESIKREGTLDVESYVGTCLAECEHGAELGFDLGVRGDAG